ncbi:MULTISPECIES: SMC-Scp complex subunit ScpB [Pseudoalteromonas]|jgi:segregation and condensation protein B|uniref:SMC-Scp complex subunit ScpB n=3 Tax=Pseudoalteromonas TaxID=53246 RepID=A0AAD0U3D1_9GAMM|nr:MULTISPECIES: SMC-Scp complex subunit ScpB [Pseudoalteromonas]MDC9519631.1 SMC-Scp complex subunit ScpB [Pseudoalteromonas sp. Angola-31]MDY6887831.1 SMC-Scp complex subunit ScpB [Pseudomonadota bacterium]GEK74790.1 segregation and condensation protein B [Pseudoalteromonas atlantica]HAG41778.1 SMC-Scp complex subunit ScpB [Pseudoalteromonas sp.]ATC82521.1 segregation and condensation protein B [Pseudoalteromonas agarivorans DSM 14585]|tara:strand:+ start:230 stop:820 length:591 start_codon:yes stop_codon:yes gene_type:complete
MAGRRISDEQLIEIIEAAIFVADKPVSKRHLKDTVLADLAISMSRINTAIDAIHTHYQTRGIKLVEVGSGYRFQACSSLSPWLSNLWQERAPKYSRALLETLSLIAYRQPITRGEIEQVRGVTTGSAIIKTLLEREWVKVVGHKEVPGKPALYATTKLFLDYFSLTGLDELPALPAQQESKINQLLSDPSVREPSE